MKVSVMATTHENYIAKKDEFDRFSGHSAGICYMPNNIESLFGEDQLKTIKRAESTKLRGHHSVFGHPYISFALEDIPKGLAMILNNENAYNTSEKSARYTKMVLKPAEENLYNKWLEIFKNLIFAEYGEKYPKIFNESKIEKLAQENARYLISVFTPTTMEYTVSYQQLNYLYQMLKNELLNENSNALVNGMKPAIKDFCEAFEKTGYIDSGLTAGVYQKNRELALFSKKTKIEEYFGDVYSTSYLGSFAELAQAQRHRTLNYSLNLLDKPQFYLPPILQKHDNLVVDWFLDCEKQATVFPQGMLININEFGNMDAFILKMKERKCTFAQLEINQQTNVILRKYIEELTSKNHPRAEELKAYVRGSRCTFPDYNCPSPCGFAPGIMEERII